MVLKPENFVKAVESQRGEVRWTALWIAVYNLVLLILFVFGMVTQVGWEGFGFLPLFALTLPWSWLLMKVFDLTGLWDLGLWGSGLYGTFLINFVVCNLICGLANSCILFVLLKRRQKKLAEYDAWERARRSR